MFWDLELDKPINISFKGDTLRFVADNINRVQTVTLTLPLKTSFGGFGEITLRTSACVKAANEKMMKVIINNYLLIPMYGNPARPANEDRVLDGLGVP